MNALKLPLIVLFQAVIPVLVLAFASPVEAGTIWNGPNITFTHNSATGELSDQWTPNVIITRSSGGGGLYNSAQESGASSGTSPKDTRWAVGTLANTNLSYGPCPLEAGNFPPGDVGKTYVVHLVNEDIYLQLTLTAWGGEGGSGDKSFSYTRSTPAVVPPTVSITNPVSGSVFAAPASLKLKASASVSGGTVTNVQFFASTSTSTNSLGSVTAAPFNLTSSGLAAGAYGLRAVATAGGISTTSVVVNVSVVNPVTVSLGGAIRGSATICQFTYAANIGLSYIIQRSADLTGSNWVTLATNVATANPATFTDVNATNNPGFYRVGLLPNP